MAAGLFMLRGDGIFSCGGILEGVGFHRNQDKVRGAGSSFSAQAA